MIVFSPFRRTVKQTRGRAFSREKVVLFSRQTFALAVFVDRAPHGGRSVVGTVASAVQVCIAGVAVPRAVPASIALGLQRCRGAGTLHWQRPGPLFCTGIPGAFPGSAAPVAPQGERRGLGSGRGSLQGWGWLGLVPTAVSPPPGPAKA